MDLPQNVLGSSFVHVTSNTQIHKRRRNVITSSLEVRITLNKDLHLLPPADDSPSLISWFEPKGLIVTMATVFLSAAEVRDDCKTLKHATKLELSSSDELILLGSQQTHLLITCVLPQAPPLWGRGLSFLLTGRTLIVYSLDECVVAFLSWQLGCYGDCQHVCLCAALWLVEVSEGSYSSRCESECVFLQ